MGKRARFARATFARITTAAVVLCAACRDGGGGGQAVVRDSGGVQIVENSEPRWEEGEGWRLSDEPEVSIGVLEGAPEQQLFRVTGALRLDDGRIVIANGGTSELRYYDAIGTYVTAVGRQGEGPGEFRGIGGLYRYGADSLLVYDFQLRRISVLSADGVYARSFTLPRLSETASPRLAGLFADGSLFVSGARLFGPGELRTGVTRDSMVVMRANVEGALLDTLGRFPGLQAFVRTIGDGNNRGFSVTTLPFGRNPQYAVVGDRFVTGNGDSYELRVHRLDGALERIIRLERSNRPVTPEDVERMKQQRLERVTDENRRRDIESGLAEMPLPATMPAYGSFVVDADRNLCVAEYSAPGEFHTRWMVFDEEGRLLGQVGAPDRFSAFEIGSDYILGRRTDELDVERVELYRLIKTGGD